MIELVFMEMCSENRGALKMWMERIRKYKEYKIQNTHYTSEAEAKNLFYMKTKK